MAVPKKITDLVERFERNIDAYRSGKYKETQLRHEFIDPFFIALGWDVNNEKGYAEAYKDVIHEDAIKVGGATKAPDYCFRIGGTRKFFLEAKKPSVDIKGAVHPAYQLRRYAWTAKLPLSMLTDFEEFAVYDCRVKPVKTDKASAARILYTTYSDYAKRWDEIASIFSRDEVLKGSFDRYVESTKRKKGTAEVDAAFLKEIETWRDMLARNIALRNGKLTQRELNFAVQRTIDRIIFLRICEDRGVETYGRLMSLLNGDHIYERLCRLFTQADDRYNSGLFHFRKEKDRPEPPDELTLSLAIDDKPLKDILRSLYYPDSPYEFSVFPADILGQVYEQFLGKVIRLTAGHYAKVEDKPEVKKAGGVYYTPTYIVDYIVKNTVGKLLGADGAGFESRPKKSGKEGKKSTAPTPKEVSKLRILDPACGSGSFLLGAYQYLLDWHRDWYANDGPDKWAKKRPPRVYQGHGGDWRLTTAERKRILLNNIYGVDIDPQAVEVTKLSLLLKVLEGESAETIGKTLELFHERALPDLGNNIKCGNSLIGPDFFGQGAAAPGSRQGVATPCPRDGRQMTMFDEEERYRINAFDWHAEFPEIMCGDAEDFWFVTFVTHNSRVSERMVQFGVTDRQGKGLQPLVLTPEEQVAVAESLFDTARRHGFAFVALNVLPDHVHAMLPAPDEKTLASRVRKLKTFSAQAINQRRQRTRGAHVWAQKFNRKHVDTENDAARIYDYINQNQLKHQETWGDAIIQTWDNGLQPLAQLHCVIPGVRPLATRSSQGAAAPCLPPGAGFDAVIGNPPYVRIQAMKQWAPREVEFYKDRYVAASKGNYDIYVVFVEKGLELLSQHGLFGMILPHKFFNAKYGEALRRLLADGAHLSQVVHFGDNQVFTGSTTYTCLLFLEKAGSHACQIAKVPDLLVWRNTGRATVGAVSATKIGMREWSFIVGGLAQVCERLEKGAMKLGELGRLFVGVQTNADHVFIVEEIRREGGRVLCKSRSTGEQHWFEDAHLKPLLKGSLNIRRYELTNVTKRLIFPYVTERGRSLLIPHDEYARQFPLTWAYLVENKKLLAARNRGQMGAAWYGYVYKKNHTLFDKPKIVVPSIAAGSRFALDLDGLYYFTGSGGGGGGGYGIMLPEPTRVGYLYLLGLLNSRLLSSYLRATSTPFRGGYFALNRQYIEKLPIRTANLSRPADRAYHDQMTELVNHMLSLHKQRTSAKTDHDKTVLQRQIDATDREIDRLVYDLYGLTDDEIRIVEEETQ